MQWLWLLVATAGAQPPPVSHCPSGGGGGVNVVPRTCQLADALASVERARELEPAVCREAAASPALTAFCGAERTTRGSCTEDTLRTVSNWAGSWAQAARAVSWAWSERPLNDLAVLEAEAQARAVELAHRAACASPAPRPARDAEARDRYLARVREIPATAVCESLEDLVGPAWSSGTRVNYSPIAETLRTACEIREESLSARAYRARALGEEIVSTAVEVTGLGVIVARPSAERRLAPAVCNVLSAYVGAEAALRAADRCEREVTSGQSRIIELARAVAGSTLSVRASCGAFDRASERARCVLGSEVRFGPYSLRAYAPSVGARSDTLVALERLFWQNRPRPTTAGVEAGDLELTHEGDGRTERCQRLGGASDALLRRDPAELGVHDARVLLASARCRRGAGDPRQRARSANELEMISEIASQSLAYRADPESVGITGLAGLILTNVPGRRERGRAMTAVFVRDGTPVETLARAVAGGARPTDEHRELAIRIGRGALERTIEAAIDDARVDVAEAAIDLNSVLVATAEVRPMYRGLADVEAAIHRSYAASRGGRRATAIAAIEEARRIGDVHGFWAGGDALSLHEIRAREVELGLREAPIAPPGNDACSRDLARRQMVVRGDTNDPAERRELIDALLIDLRKGEPDAARCTSRRGYLPAEIRARLLLARLLVSCVEEGECLFDANRALAEIRSALDFAARAVTDALEDLGRHGDVDRSRPLAELAREIAATAELAALFPWREHGASAAAIQELSWLAFRVHDCLAYPDVRVNLRWLSGHEAPACQLGPDPDADPSRLTLVYVEHGERRRRYGVWVRRGSELVRVDLGRAERIDRVVEELNRALSDPAAPYADLAEETRERVLAPALEALHAPRDAPLIVLPSGAISAIPFAVLTGDPARVRYALSTRPMRPPRPLGFRAAVVVADPVFGSARGEIARLPGTLGEAEAVCGVLDCGGRRLVGREATEARFFAAVQERLGEYGVVHLATHGIFGGTDGISERAAILLAGVGDTLPEATPWDSGSDGMVSESELAALGLDRTDLVVLSACGTGRGEARAGVRGLARAARVSGARAVIGSLWSVDDRATGVLMREFYTRLRRNVPMNVALSEASAAVRERNPHPYYWAPFVLLEGS
jgi:CHAT domain-containing protein